MVSSLHHRNYRLFFFGQLVSVAGTWMQTVAQSFLVLELTHSGTQLGLATAVRFLPMFVFGPLGGVFADRMDKRRVLYLTQSLSGLLAGVFAVTVGTHVIRLWLVYLLALALGFVNVFDNPARQSFISEMVPPADLPNAVTLNSVAMNMARVFGAALGGVIAAAIGLALCFACNALSFAAVLVSLAAMRKSELFPAKRVARKKRQVRQGLRYVRRTPELLIPLLMIAVVGTLAWEFQVTLPLMASDAFHRGAAAYGVMASVMGAGAVVGGLISAARSRPRARALCLAAVGWGIAILAAAAAPSLPLELVALVFVGYGSITFNSLAKTTLQLAAKPEMRGRVMALWALAWLGSTPIGGPVVGWVGQVVGPRWALVIGGLPTVICGIAALPALTRIDRRAARRQAAAEATAPAEAAGPAEAAAPAEAAEGLARRRAGSHRPRLRRPGGDQLAQARRVQGRLDGVGRAPQHPPLLVVEDALLLDLVGVGRGERGAEDEHDLMLGTALPAEDVLQHAEQPYVGQGLAQFLAELPVHGIERVLRELHVPAQRPLEQRVVRLRDKQRPVPGPPDDGHRLDDLPLALIRVHRPPITCLPFCYINI
jgi:MFS family permease